jgi:hypothetical protein
MADRDASSIETSRNTPSPVRPRPARAAQIDIAATRPPTESETGKPTRSGTVSGVPVMLIIPDRPWMIWSYAGA